MTSSGIRPLLAHIYDPARVTYPCHVQPKLNGIRALYQNGRFQSRDLIPFPANLLKHLAEPLRQTFSPEVILDGELYVHGWPLQRINAAVTPVRQQPTEDTFNVAYHIFDVVDYTKSFEERVTILKSADDKRSFQLNWFAVPTWQVPNETNANGMYSHFVGQNYEGMMYRLGDCPYTVPKQEKSTLQNWVHDKINKEGFGTLKTKSKFLSDKDNRCWLLLKRKDWQDDEFECYGVEEGEGKLHGTLGAIVYRHKDGRDLFDKFGKRPTVGSGLTDSQRHYYWQNPPIGKLIKVKYLVLSKDGIPLNPTVHPDHIIL